MADTPATPVATGASPGGLSETTVAGTPVSSYRWTIVGLLTGNNFAMVVTGLSLGLLLPDITDSLGLTDLQGGWLSAAMRIGTIGMAFPAAIFLSKYSPLRLSILSAFLGGLFTLGHGVASSFAVLFLVRLGFGLSYAARVPARTLLMQQWFPLREIVVVNGIVIGLTGIAEAFALNVTPLLLDVTGSWRTTYYIFGAGSLAVFALWLVAGRERSTPEFQQRVLAEGKLPVGALFKYPVLWFVGLGSIGTGLGWWTFATFWPTYMLEEHSFSLARSGFVFSLMSIGMIPASVGAGFLAKRIQARYSLLAASGIIMTVSLVGLVLTTNIWLLVALALIGGGGFAFVPIAVTIPFEIPGIQPREVAVASTMIMTLMMVGGVIGPVIAGAISDATGSMYMALFVCALTPLTLVVFPAFARTRAA